MRSRLVRGRRCDAPVNLNEQEPGGVLLLLQQFKSSDAGFLNTEPRIGEGGLAKGFDAFGFNVGMDMNDQHTGQLSNPAAEEQVRCGVPNPRVRFFAMRTAGWGQLSLPGKSGVRRDRRARRPVVCRVID